MERLQVLLSLATSIYPNMKNPLLPERHLAKTAKSSPPADRAAFATLLEAGRAGGGAGEFALRAGDGGAVP